ncbi:MAG: amino acid permease [Ignavibacteria bacterium]|nr:amino acid permease [Ignavibacteria bacterium]
MRSSGKKPPIQSNGTLKMFDVVMLVISLVIGMGIFRAPAVVASRSGNETIFYLAWITGGVIAICGALAFADIGRRMPVTGAYYRIYAKAYHPVVAFAVNVIILVSNAASAAGVAIIGAEYVASWLPGVHTSITATTMIVVLYGLNLLGLRTSATVQNVLIGIKVLMLLCIIAALVLVDAAPTTTVSSVLPGKGLWESFGLALIAVSFTYGGYQSTINFGGEISDSTRKMPLAIVLGVLIITTIYLLANLAYVHVLGFDQLAHSTSIAAMVVDRLFGSAGSTLLSIVLVISVFGYVNVAMLSNPRVINAMSEDGVLPTRLSSSSGGFRHGSLIAFTLLSVLCVYVGESFERILNYTIFIDAIGLACGAASIYWLAGPRVRPHIHIAVGVFVLSCVFTAVNIAMFDTMAAVYGLALFAVVILVGIAMFMRRSRATQTDDTRHL